MKVWAKICCEDGVVYEKKFDTPAEAMAFCEGFTQTVNCLALDDEDHFVCVDDRSAETEVRKLSHEEESE